MTSKRNLHRRGIAMMLVLFSVAMATILATAYLVSRDNSIAISRNNAAAAQARWSSLSALETSVAILQTKTDWRGNHTAGALLSDYPLAGGNVEIIATDLETDGVPGPGSEYLKLKAIADVDVDGDGRPDGRQETEFLAYVPIIARERAAVDLAEFAVFVRDDLTMTENASLARWPTAPLSKLGRRIAVGTRSEGSSSIVASDDAACVDCTVYHVDTASGSLVLNANGPPITQFAMPFKMKVPDSPEHGEPDPPVTSSDLRTLNGETTTISTYKRYDDVELNLGAVLTLQGDIILGCDDDLLLRGGSTVVIDGNVTIVVFDDIVIEANSSIELEPSSTLKVFNGDDIYMTDGYIGQRRTDDTRDHTGYEPHMDPWRIQIYSIEDTAEDLTWRLEGNSVIKGSVYGPTVLFKVLNDSALYGRVVADDVVIANNSAIFYDHALDERQGFTNPKSPLFNGTNFDSTFTASTLNPSDLVTLADSTNAVIHAGGYAYTPTTPEPPPPPPGPTDPTPRPVPVDHLMITYGTNMNVFEHPDNDADINEGSSKSGGEEMSGF